MHFEAKNGIRNAFIIIAMYGSFTKSFPNDTFCQEAQHIKTLPSSMYIWSASNRFRDIYTNYDFCIQNPCRYKYGYIIPFTLANDGWNWSVHMSLPMNDDISTYFLCQKFSYFSFVTFWLHMNLHFFRKTNEIFTHSFRDNLFTNPRISSISNDITHSTVRDRSNMLFKFKFYCFCDGIREHLLSLHSGLMANG